MHAISPLAARAPGASQPSPLLRIITPRRTLPGSRAIVGGLLISLAAVGTFAVASGATSHDKTSYVVAGHDLSAGSRITAGDLKTVDLSLTPELSSQAFASTSKAVGATLLGPVKQGELIQSGAVSFKASGPSQPEMSFSLPASRALGGGVRSGESIDVLVTDKGGALSAARIAVANARVIRVDRTGSGGLGANGDVTLTVALAERSEAAALAAAVDSGAVTLVRTTGVITSPSTQSPG